MPNDPEHKSSHEKGYEDGFEGREQSAAYYCYTCYQIGYALGLADRMEVQRASSSNT